MSGMDTGRASEPDVWLWLGDNMYTEEDGTNIHGQDLNKVAVCVYFDYFIFYICTLCLV